MRFDAHVGQHSAKNDLVDLPLVQLKNEVVGLRAPDLMRRDDDSFAVLDVWFKRLQPISAGPFKAIETRMSAIKRCVKAISSSTRKISTSVTGLSRMAEVAGLGAL